MINPRDVDAFEELRAALAIEPSADFVARVRARVADRPVRASWLGNWKLTLAAAVVTIGIAAGAAWLNRTESPSVPQATSTATQTEVPAPALAIVPPTTSTLTRRSAPRGGRRGLRATAASNEPEVLVPPDQAIAIRRLLASFRAGRVPVVSDLRNMDEVSGDLPPISMIEIPLITIEPLPGPAGGDRERNPS